MPATLSMTGSVAVITLDDGKANAVNHELLESLEACLDEAEVSAGAVVLAGREGKFSAGYDLKVLQSGDQAAANELVMRGGRMVKRLYGYPKPLVAASTGHAVALGAFWLLACDTRVGALGAFKIGLNETLIGMALPQFALALTQSRLNPQVITESAIQSKFYDADGAIAAGFLDMATEPDQVLPTAIQIAGQLAELPGDAYAANKSLLRQAALDAMGV